MAHLFILVAIGQDGVIVIHGQDEVSGGVLHRRQQVDQGHIEALTEEGDEQVIEEIGVVEEELGGAGELACDLFGGEYAHLFAHHQVHEGAHQQLFLVLHCLDVQHGAVHKLHHHPEGSVSLIVVVFLEEFGRACREEGVPLGVGVGL